jgi:Fur family transcriptional regulator, zinc uptake regulator
MFRCITDSGVLVKFHCADDFKNRCLRGGVFPLPSYPAIMQAMPHAHAPRAEQIAEAQRRCAASGENLTPLRQRVLELLIDADGPAKAYDLLPLIDANGQAKPPTVYRALDFLVRMGLAHRIESLNAFVACDVGACARSTIFLICDKCGGAEEFDAGHALVDLTDAARRDGFAINRTMIEASGLCAACQHGA